MDIKTILLGTIVCLAIGCGFSGSREGEGNAVYGTEYHVSVKGDDAGNGSADRPLRTISAAAQLAQPGDMITVHEGTYRERISPPRGGSSDTRRIVYQAAPGEQVYLKGSEVIKGWQKLQNDTWTVTIPNAFFGDFNPFNDLIHGDWFDPLGRSHHTGAVYLNDHWLIEAANREDVLEPVGQSSSSYAPGNNPYLLNVAWLQPEADSQETVRIPAADFAAHQGIQTAPCSEGGECIGFIERGEWVRYENVEFGPQTTQISLRAASATCGGIIEIRLDAPDGELLGRCQVPHTGGWQAWFTFKATIKPLSGPKTICLLFQGPHRQKEPYIQLWFAQVDDSNTTLWAQFKDVNPNEAEVEVNVRRTVFYPEKTGVNYLTVRGFTMRHAATPWAPPTAEQIGLIGTNWSKGWIIENNDIAYSVCTGVTLGKHGDQFDNASANSAEGYVKTIERALERGWSKDNIGHHIVRNNHISHCEQAGLVGSMGAVFSTITGNDIHDIHVRQLFSGAEMAGIKIHGAIDTVISHNHIYRTGRGIWLDWMAQGARVTGNLLHDTAPAGDLFVEVNHGPLLVDNNLFLSPASLDVNSQGGSYVHNLITGNVFVIHTEGRQTPYHPAHSTEVAGLADNPSGDERYYNNILVNVGAAAYDAAGLPVFMAGNVFLNGAQPSKHEPEPLVLPQVNPAVQLLEKPDGLYLAITLDTAWSQPPRQLVTSERLGKAKIPDLPYEQPDGSPYRLDTDYFGNQRNAANPFPGPFEWSAVSRQELKLWPLPTVP